MTAGLRSFGRLWRYDRGLLLAYGLASLFLLAFVVAPLVRVALEPTLTDWGTESLLIAGPEEMVIDLYRWVGPHYSA